MIVDFLRSRLEAVSPFSASIVKCLGLGIHADVADLKQAAIYGTGILAAKEPVLFRDFILGKQRQVF